MAQVDSEANSGLLDELEITRVPTVLIYKAGQIKARGTGVHEAG